MTWIRWETGTPRSDVVGFLADRLNLKVQHALGYYSAMCCGFGDDRPDGRIDQVTDASLENWAMWDGKRGRFAAVIREWCALPMPDGSPRPDPGLLRGWWRNEAVLRKQRADAGKPDGRRPVPENHPPESPANPARDSGGILGGNDNEYGDGGSSLREEPLVSVDGLRPEVAIAVAANTGLRENPGIRGFNELLPNQALEMAPAWLRDEIPLQLICDTVFTSCRKYRVSPGNTQPKSFRYFDGAVRAAHAKATGKAEMAGHKHRSHSADPVRVPALKVMS